MTLQNFPYPDTLIIVFAREPLTGQVKTRLIPTLGKEGATELYRRLLDYTVDNVIAAALSPVNICITPESSTTYFTQMSCAEQFEISLQTGHDLGARMYHAIASGLQQYSKVILIGTDCPFLRKDDFQQAIMSLDANDMVFSPAIDGGYVLIGAKKVIPEIFANIDWGTDRVMAQSRQALSDNDFCWRELSQQCDIDVKEDLNCLVLHDDFKDLLLIN